MTQTRMVDWQEDVYHEEGTEMAEKVSPYSNVSTSVEGGKLIITCDLDPRRVDMSPSKSGKSNVLATTGGAVMVANGTKLNLTVYQPC